MKRKEIATGVANATIAAGMAHLAIGIGRNRAEIDRWRRRGWWNSVQPDDMAAQSALWFTTAGAALIVRGVQARETVRTTGTLPRSFGLATLVSTMPIAILQPKSGAWGLLAIGAAALIAAGELSR